MCELDKPIEVLEQCPSSPLVSARARRFAAFRERFRATYRDDMDAVVPEGDRVAR